MSSDTSREAILRAARRQFAERGFARTTVRDIAQEAEVSAALVIKLFVSKSGLYTEAGQFSIPLSELDLPRAQLGRALVRRLVTRRDDDVIEPWVAIPLSVRDAPDPEATRTDFRAHSLSTIAGLIGETTPALTHASIVVSQLVGLAAGMRVLGLFPSDALSSDDLVDLWAPIIQAQIDSIDRGDPGSGSSASQDKADGQPSAN